MAKSASPAATRRVVFDCNVYLQAAVRDGGPAFACVELAEAGSFTLLASADVFAELADVLSRPSVRRKFTALKDEHVDAYLQRVYKLAELVTAIPSAFVIPRDPKDEPYINLAIAGKADLIVSRDNDLLSLSSADDEVSSDFRAHHPGIQVLDPVEFLREIRSDSSRTD